MRDIYSDDSYLTVKKPEDIGRTDWHHNEEGQVDYLPLGYIHDCNNLPTKKSEPIEKQKYNYKYEAMLEQGCRNLAEINARRFSWDNYYLNRAYD